MKVGISIVSMAALLAAMGTISYGQAPAGSASSTPTPASTAASSAGASAGASAGSSLPTVDGTVHYALSASEIVQYGYSGAGDVTGSTALSGNASYSSKSEKAPFSLLFAGGVLFPNSSGQGVSTYQNLAASQSLITGKWVLGLSDSVSYLPQSPTTGLSGIPGVGDIGALPIEGPSGGPAGGVLTFGGNRISNSLSGSVERLLTGRTSVSGTGSWTVLHFLSGNNGFDNSQVAGEAGLNHRIDARDTISANGIYSVFTFGKNEGGLSFETRGVNGAYSRVLNSTMSVSLSAGPQWVFSSNSILVPSSLNLAANAGLSYTRKLTNASIGYSRGVNGGSGVQLGGLSDMVSAGVGHPLGRDWLASASGAYSHTSSVVKGLVTPPSGGAFPLGGNFSTVYGGVQVSHSLSRTVSAYLSYGAQHQTYDRAFTGTNAFNGTSHTFGIGISFAPRAVRLGQF